MGEEVVKGIPSNLGISRRLTVLENIGKDHARVLVEHGQSFTRVLDRIDRIEDVMQANAIEDARKDEREKQMAKDIAGTAKDVASIKSAVTWFLRVVGGAVILAMVTWVLRGNLLP